MKIDHEQNPLGIVKRFDILYNKKRHLEGRIIAHTEEGFDAVNWFSGEVRYPGACEIGGIQRDKDYQDLKKGALTQKEIEWKMRNWCYSFGLKIFKEIEETIGLTR